MHKGLVHQGVLAMWCPRKTVQITKELSHAQRFGVAGRFSQVVSKIDCPDLFNPFLLKNGYGIDAT